MRNLVGDTNDTASRARTRVTGLLGLGVVALAEVVGAAVDDDGAADDAVLADELDQLVGDGALCVALAVGLEVTQVTDVALLILGSTVVLAVGVDLRVLAFVWSFVVGLRELTVRAGGSAAVGVVAKGVDVHATLSVGIVAGDVP